MYGSANLQTYISSPLNNKELVDDAVKQNLMKAKRQLVRLRLIPRIRAKLLETFIKPVRTVYRKLHIVKWMIINEKLFRTLFDGSC